jgi:hypothetical protein
LIPILTRAFGWSPHDAWSLTGTQLNWWNDALNELNAQERTMREG